MARWDFIVDHTGWAVDTATLDGARREAQKLVDYHYGKGKYVVNVVQKPRQQPKLVVTKVVPPVKTTLKVWRYAIPMGGSATCKQFVNRTVEAQLAATACVKAQSDLDGSYGRGVFQVVVGMSPDGEEQLQVRRN